MEIQFSDAMSTKQTAEFLGKTERTIANYKRDGKLLPIGVFGRSADVYLKETVEAFKASMDTGDSSPAVGDFT